MAGVTQTDQCGKLIGKQTTLTLVAIANFIIYLSYYKVANLINCKAREYEAI